jgi:hypothetical protein
MTLYDWLAAQGVGAKSALAYATGLSWATIDRACKGRAQRESAEIIHRATRREVPIGAMTLPPRKRVANPAKLKRLAS